MTMLTFRNPPSQKDKNNKTKTISDSSQLDSVSSSFDASEVYIPEGCRLWVSAVLDVGVEGIFF